MTRVPFDAGLEGTVGVKRSLEHLRSILRRDESVILSAGAFLEGRSGVLAATDRRLLFVWRDQTPIDAPYESITHFRARVGVVAAELEIEDPVGRALVKQLHPRRRLREFAGLLEERTRNIPGPRTA